MSAHALCCAATVWLMLALPARASTDFVTNGSFSTTTCVGNGCSNVTGQLTYNILATDWISDSDGDGHDGYNFIFAAGTADTAGAQGDDGTVELWGSNNGGIDTLPASSPDGGNYLAADGAYQIGAITQQIDGLTVGDRYTLGYWWAGAQQSGFNGVTTDQWQVSVGDLTQDTAIVTDPSHAFTGWMYQTFTFVADEANPLLSFLSSGTPTGEPPFALLDGVTLEAAPEPATTALIGFGLIAIPLAARLRRRRR